MIKKVKNRWRLNVLVSVILRMSYGSELQAVGPVTENARSPSFVLVGGTVYDRLSVDERCPCRRDEAAVSRTMLLM